ncbi:MAG: aspartate carbamoyltransferase catalytic subunit [Clostridia bacterium]|nr:aspartate carbamoyltransferase catalytic subunit [Clostridia bacterium]
MWPYKDLLGLRELSAEEIGFILDTAKSMKEVLGREVKKIPALSGKVVATLFYEPSTRTRISFELAAKYLGADTVSIATQLSSVAKGENLADTGRTLQAMGVDAVVLRHPSSGAAHYLASKLSISVLNAGDGTHEHPTQALLDLFTIRETFGDLRGLVVAIIGDILHSRVARSNIFGLTKLGAEVRVAGPGTLVPPALEQMGAKIYRTVKEAVSGANVINVLRIQFERQEDNFIPSVEEYNRFFALTPEVLQWANPRAVVLHPGPVNRGIEIDSRVADGPSSVILHQVTNGVAVRMAVLYLAVGRGKENVAPN